MFDANEKIVVFNRRFLEMYKLSPQVVKPGCTLARADPASQGGRPAARPIPRALSRNHGRHPRRAKPRSGPSRPPTAGSSRRSISRCPAAAGSPPTRTSPSGAAPRTIRDQKLQMDAALNNISQGLLMFDADTRLIICNRRYLRALRPVAGRCEARHSRLKDCWSCARPTAPSRSIPQLRARAEGRAGGGQAVTLTPELADGRIMSIANYPMQDGRWVSTHEDITEQRRAEKQLARAESAARHRAQQHVAGPQHVRCVRAPRGLQRALSADVRLSPDIVKPGMHGRGAGPGADRRRARSSPSTRSSIRPSCWTR